MTRCRWVDASEPLSIANHVGDPICNKCYQGRPSCALGPEKRNKAKLSTTLLRVSTMAALRSSVHDHVPIGRSYTARDSTDRLCQGQRHD